MVQRRSIVLTLTFLLGALAPSNGQSAEKCLNCSVRIEKPIAVLAVDQPPSAEAGDTVPLAVGYHVPGTRKAKKGK